jgi:pimeloyl-[acyl-carrier protein] methyl ester esterase
MRLALAQPHKVSRLALVGATPRFVNGDGWQCGVEAEVFHLFAGQVEDDYAGTMDRFLGLQAFGGESSRATIRQLRARFLLRPPPERQTLQAALQILLTSDLRDEVARLRQPLLLLHGARDTLAPVAAAHWLAQQLPQSELRVIAGSAHAPFLSHPTAFVQALTDFMR